MYRASRGAYAHTSNLISL